MSKRESELSRASRNQNKQKENRLLNILIAVVVLAIIITIAIIIKNISGSDTANSNQDNQQQEVVDKEDKEQAGEDEQQADEREVEEELIPPDPGTVTYLTSDDPIVLETIVDMSWEPIATEQTGEHQSSYDGDSLDWQEKKQAIAYAVGHAEDNLIYKKVKNGGSPSKAIGIVSTKDKEEMFQVFIDWVDGAGWKPTKVDVLTTLDFDY